jgi:putative ABC transport system permease protein
MLEHHSHKDTRSTKAFRALLALYPGAFRDEYQRELMLVFVDRHRDSTSGWDRARLWFEALSGILAEAPKEHGRMILQDLHYAVRMLRQHALVTITIIITLGLGIGANTAVFSLLNAVMFRSLAVPDADQLFMVNVGSLTASLPESARLSGPMFDRLRQAPPDGVGVAAMSRAIARVHTRTEGAVDTTPANLQLVSPSFFAVLGVSPVLGRTLPDDGDGFLATAPVAVVSYGYWQRRFGGSSDVVGRTLTINGTAFTVIGVGPRDFAGVWLETPVDIWVPLTMQSAVKYSRDFSADGADLGRPWLPQERIWWLAVVVRSPRAKAAAVRGAFNATLSDQAHRDVGVVLDPFARGFSQFRQQFSAPLFALLGMATLVMLIACGNVANLLLARAAARQREIAMRMALGAGRARVLHQLLTESALLVVMAGVAAVLFARWAGDLLIRTATATAEGPSPFAAPLDLRVLVFTASVAFVSVLVFGLIPAWRASRLDLVAALNAGARGVIGSSGTRPARVMVVLQVALSLVLVTGTGLMIRSFQNLLQVDLGFDREHLLSVAIDPRIAGTPDLAELQGRALHAAASVPGVESVALAMCGLQSSCRVRQDGIDIEGYQPRADEEIIFTFNAVSPEYFSTVGMRLIAGRALNDRDRLNSATVAVVNRALATTYFADGQAIGRHFGQTRPDVEIVGIVDDARSVSVKEPAAPAVFFSLSQRPVAARSLEVRTKGAPQQAITALRRAIADAAPELPIEGIVPIEERVRLGLSRERLLMFLTSGFGALALGLAGFGLFGILSYAIARRTSEFGVRMALGASRSRVLWSVVREAQWLVFCGFLLGVPFVLVGGNLVSTLFFGVSPHDWPTLLTATITLMGVGSICSVIPALRASRVDPIVALRQE